MKQKADLKKIKLFAEMPDDVLTWLCDKVRWKTFSKGEYLFHEGEDSTKVYAITSGRIKIVKEFPNGKNAIIGLFAPGEIVAEVAAVDHMPYPASGIAMEDSKVAAIPSTAFLLSLEKAPGAAIKLMAHIGAKMRRLTGDLGSLSTQKVEKRLARFLVNLPHDSDTPESTEIKLNLTMTRKDLAEIIGTSFEVVERALKKMREEKVISVNGKKIVIHDIDRLSEISEE